MEVSEPEVASGDGGVCGLTREQGGEEEEQAPHEEGG